MPPGEESSSRESFADAPNVDELCRRELNAIVERACLETKASGAALALLAGSRFLCCARAGDCAPSLGAELDRNAGISGACLRSGEPVRCNDVFGDARVDREAARRLGISSILAVPLRQDGASVGLLEVFARTPYAFGSPEQAALQQTAQQVLRLMRPERHASPQDDWRPALSVTRPPEPSPEPAQAPAAIDVPDVAEEAAPAVEAGEPTPARTAESAEPALRASLMSLMPADSQSEYVSALEADEYAHRDRRRKLRLLLFVAALAVLAGLLAMSVRGIGLFRKSSARPSQSKALSRIEQLRRAAEQGNAPAQLELAARYRMGDGVAHDDAESVRWLQEAARLGNGDAQYELGNAYADGRGVARDPINAYACYVLAGANGNVASEEALKFLNRKLSSAQIAQVRTTVGTMYEQGRGTPVDYVAAYSWFSLAEAAGSADGRRAREFLASKMSQEQIDAAQQRAAEWLKRHP